MNTKSKSTWGGPWTEKKLDAFEKYVKAYLKIMNHYRDQYKWKIEYLDAFAGSGDRGHTQDSVPDDAKDNSLFDFPISIEEQNVYKGAAERVVSIGASERGFDEYFFVETNEASRNSLQKKLSYYHPNGKVYYCSEDANNVIQRFSGYLKRDPKRKALVFIDPFGMQVDWESIETLQSLSVDLWILVPTGTIINRLLECKLDKNIGLRHGVKLSKYFGLPEDEIIKYFYQETTQPSLFEDEITNITKVNDAINKIADLYITRLKSIFVYVTEKPLPLYNSTNIPIFHFIFASQNEKAVKIAKDIIDKT